MEIRFCQSLLLLITLTTSNFTSANSVPSVTEEAWQLINQKKLSSAQSILAEWLKKVPEDIEAKYLYARTLAWNNKTDEAISLIDKLLEKQPQNSDFLFTKATVLSWQKKTNSAISILDNARHISPGDKAIWNLELKLLKHKVSEASEKNHLKFIALKNKYEAIQTEYYLQFLERYQAPATITRISTKKENYLLLGKSHEKLSIDTGDWQSTLLELGTIWKKHPLSFSFENSSRFNMNDNQAMFSALTIMDNNLQLNTSIAASSSNDLYPVWQFAMEASKSLKKINILQYKWQHRKYSTDVIDSNNLSFSRYFGSFLPKVTVNITTINNNDILPGYSTSLSWFINDKDFIRISFSQGKEAEYLNKKLEDITKTEFIGVDGRWNIISDWNALIALGHHKQGTVYNKDGIFIGLQRRF
ncbi:MAG: YaiO family outer membrane beta-barrel protein [Gammaproteobacteria bacterium]|nr:YaiO family outer membrane beta-barrel protein [Gammaproteobacteria bacterium]